MPRIFNVVEVIPVFHSRQAAVALLSSASSRRQAALVRIYRQTNILLSSKSNAIAAMVRQLLSVVLVLSAVSSLLLSSLHFSFVRGQIIGNRFRQMAFLCVESRKGSKEEGNKKRGVRAASSLRTSLQFFRAPFLSVRSSIWWWSLRPPIRLFERKKKKNDRASRPRCMRRRRDVCLQREEQLGFGE